MVRTDWLRSETCYLEAIATLKSGWNPDCLREIAQRRLLAYGEEKNISDDDLDELADRVFVAGIEGFLEMNYQLSSDAFGPLTEAEQSPYRGMAKYFCVYVESTYSEDFRPDAFIGAVRCSDVWIEGANARERFPDAWNLLLTAQVVITKFFGIDASHNQVLDPTRELVRVARSFFEKSSSQLSQQERILCILDVCRAFEQEGGATK